MRKIAAACFLFLMYYNGSSQQIHGTLIIGGMCVDGILLVADSRGSVYPHGNQSSSPISYIDSLQKIFPYKNYLVSVSGSMSISGLLIKKIIDSFHFIDKSYDFFSFGKEFRNYVKSIREKDSIYTKKLPTIILAGYQLGLPKFIGFDNSKYIISEGIIASEGKAMEYMRRIPSGDYTCIGLVPYFENVITEFANKTNQTESIGGPVSAYKISKDGLVSCIKNDFSKNGFLTTRDMINAMLSGALKVFELVPDGLSKTVNQLKKDKYYK